MNYVVEMLFKLCCYSITSCLCIRCFREKEVLSVKLNDLKAELATVVVQRDELEKSNLETRLQVINKSTV